MRDLKRNIRIGNILKFLPEYYNMFFQSAQFVWANPLLFPKSKGNTR